MDKKIISKYNKRNYCLFQANQILREYQKKRTKNFKITQTLKIMVMSYLMLGWSNDLALRIAVDNDVSHLPPPPSEYLDKEQKPFSQKENQVVSFE